MMAINHALTGAVIGFTVTNPVIAVPLALASHFVCDALPHFGSNGNEASWLSSKWFTRLLISDIALCILLVLILAVNQPAHWFVASLCAFVATSPDALWFPKYLRSLQGKKSPARPHWLLRFASWIQWYQRPAGIAVEIAWFAAAVVILLAYL